MKISYKWLQEYVHTDLRPEKISEILTSIGLEVEGLEEVEAIPGGLRGLVVGQVVACEPHPDSDHMHVCRVAVQAEPGAEPLQIVCGAPNVAQGQKVIVATVGAVLTPTGSDKSFTIKRSKLRGVESLGMICAEDEIGVGASHDGIIVLPDGATVGQPAAEYYHLESDFVFEIGITPNRADACSHLGVARDLVAYLTAHPEEGCGEVRLTVPDVSAFRVDNHDLEISVEVEAKEACPRYCAVTLTDCHVAESPDWLKQHLQSIGLRPINNVVDVTNYVLWAVGQPLHCFDADMIAGRKVVVRTQPEGTRFQTLDGVEHTLSDRDLCICNAEEAMCIAGVFGGKGSGTYETTRNILLESAYFHPTWIRKSARRHQLQTDASFRFERGIDPDGQIYALKLAAVLIQELTGGKVSMDIVDVEQPGLQKAFDVALPLDYLDSLVGKHIPLDDVLRITEALEMHPTLGTAGSVLGQQEAVHLHVPGYRVDVQRPCDVVEDILRIYGYNNVEIPTALRSSLTVRTDTDRAESLLQTLSEQLVGMGYREILNNSLTASRYYQQDDLVHVMNPLSSDLDVLRASMLHGGLEVVSHNAKRQMPNLRLFEVGKTYRHTCAQKGADGVKDYEEENHLALWLTGANVESTWTHADEATSFFHLKGAVEALIARLGIPAGLIVKETTESAELSHALVYKTRRGDVLAEVGLVRRALLAAHEIESDVFFADLHWDALVHQALTATRKYKDPAKYPAVRRDLALLLPDAVAFEKVEETCRRTERKLLQSVELFDVYEGKNLPQGTKSYAIRLMLQDENATLSEKTIEKTMTRIIEALKKDLGAELR